MLKIIVQLSVVNRQKNYLLYKFIFTHYLMSFEKKLLKILKLFKIFYYVNIKKSF